MKKLAMVLAAFSLVACGEETDPPPGPVADICPGALYDTKCDGDKLMECDNVKYVLKENCADNSKVCKKNPLLANTAACEDIVPPVDEFGACTGTGQGDCDTGLACMPLGLGNVVVLGDYCTSDCSTAACGTESYCEDFFFATPSCWFQVGPTEGCLPGSDGSCSVGDCVDTYMLNQVVQTGPTSGFALWSSQCGLECPATEIGTTGSCPDLDGEVSTVEMCMDSGFVDFEYTDANPPATIPCTSGAPECTTADGYICMPFGDEDLCAQSIGYCGYPVATTTDFSAANVSSNGFADFCGDSFLTCEPLAGTNEVQVECTQFGTGIWIFPRPGGAQGEYVTCQHDSDCLQFETQASNGTRYETGTCVNTDTYGNICAQYNMLCAAYCDDPEDVAGALACPAGQSCNTPEVMVGRYQGEFDINGASIPCTTIAQCDDTNRFDCIQFSDGKYCAREPRVCIAD